KLMALNISLDTVINNLRQGNIQMPAGPIAKGSQEITIRTFGQYTDIEQIRNAVVAEKDGRTIRLEDIASVDDTWQRITRIIRMNGERGIRLAVRKQSGANTVEIANQVLAEV